jgi:hypothetical protein
MITLTVRGTTIRLGTARTGPQGPPGSGGGGGSGDVVGPASATDNAVARFDTTTGKLLQNSAVTIDDSGNIATPGTVDGRDVSADGSALDAHVANTSNPHATTAAQVGAAPTSRQVIAGAGLTGGGDLTADRTLAVGANADGSIVVNADDIQVGVLASDAQHGNRGGGSLHSAATSSAAGFMSAAQADMLYEESQSAVFVEDYDGTSLTARMTSAVSGAGAAITQTAESGAYGVAQLTTGTTTTGRACSISASIVRLGDGSARYDSILRIPTLDDLVDTFIVIAGIGGTSTGEHANGCYFAYDRTIGTNWQCKTSSSSVRTTADSGVAVTTSYVRLTVIVNAAGTSVAFYINGVLVATITTNIPTLAATFNISAGIFKSAGANARTVLCDRQSFKKDFATPRP